MSLHDMQQALDDWRRAERRLEQASRGTPEWTLAMTDVERTRGRYQELVTAHGDHPCVESGRSGSRPLDPRTSGRPDRH